MQGRCKSTTRAASSRKSRTPWIPNTPHSEQLQHLHRFFNPPNSTSHNSVNLSPNKIIVRRQLCQYKMAYTEQDLQDTVAKYHEGGRSLRKISREFGIPTTTLYDRIHGTQTHSTAAELQQILSPVQEAHLTRWVLSQVALGVPPTHVQIREFASRVLQAQGSGHTTVGKGWITRFLRRNPVLRTQRSRKIHSVRINGATDSVICSWWPRLNLSEIKDILPANRYNFDEFDLMEGQGINGLVVGSSKTRAIQRRVPRSRAWTSFLKCISATGVALPLAVIFKGKSLQQQWFPVNKAELKDWLFTAIDKGWTNRVVALEWLQRVFIP